MGRSWPRSMENETRQVSGAGKHTQVRSDTTHQLFLKHY